MPATARVLNPPSRGVYKLRGKFLGQNAYYAITSNAELLNGCVYVVRAEILDEQLVRWLFRELDARDREGRRHLQLVPRTVEPSVDGPSTNHPEISRVLLVAADRALMDNVWEGASLDDEYRELVVRNDVARSLHRQLFGLKA